MFSSLPNRSRKKISNRNFFNVNNLLSQNQTLPKTLIAFVLLACTAAARADVVTEWNTLALDAIRAAGTPPPVAARALAMTHIAVYDAVNAVEQTGNSYSYTGKAPAGTSEQAAAAQAAHDVLVSLYPARKAIFDQALAADLASIPNGAEKTNGITLGVAVCSGVIAMRTGDGSVNTQSPYLGGSAPGQWRPTPSGNLPGLLPNWGGVTPFSMTSDSQFRLDAPPALTSQAYADAYNQVQALGSATSTARTADQTEIAKFWADGAGTATPPGHWNEIAQAVAQAQGNTLAQNARLFALLNIGLADAGIAAWDMKYTYDFWRPITAINQGDSDGNALTLGDPTWKPMLTTPNFPSYVSGHSTFSATAATILANFYGTDAIAFTSDSDPGAAGFSYTRSFTSFSQAAEEAGMSRIYGGIHFSFDNEAGLQIGDALGQYVFATQLTTVPEPSALTLMAGFVLTGACLRRRTLRSAKTVHCESKN